MTHPSPEAELRLDFIAYHTKAEPNRLACIDLRTGERVDYRTLDRLIDQAAGVLWARLGAPSGQRVASLLRNGLDAVLLHYACDRTGAIYAPLNWRLTGREIAAMVADAQPALLVCEPEFLDAAGPALAATPGLALLEAGGPQGDFRRAVLASPAAAPRPSRADAPWTLLYTSGTTGRPKGVIVTRQGATWGSRNFALMNRIGFDAVLLCDPPLFHTLGLFGITRTALQTGATIVLSDRFDAAQTLARISDPELGVTHYFGVPQIGRMLLDQPGFGQADLSRLRAIVMGGAPMQPDIALAFADRGVPIANGFGITEASSVMHMPPDLERIRAKPCHVGFPPPGIEVRLVRPDGRDAETGEVGELWLRGPSVTPGYWNQPEATAAAFTDGWLRTGDAARRDEDGAIEIVDRWKDMYISGGENVYPSEVEAVIAQMPGVVEVAVIGTPNERWGETGCAFVVAAPSAGLREADVLAFCAGRLAGYKRPGEVRLVEALPRTASGKVQKHVLRAETVKA